MGIIIYLFFTFAFNRVLTMPIVSTCQSQKREVLPFNLSWSASFFRRKFQTGCKPNSSL